MYSTAENMLLYLTENARIESERELRNTIDKLQELRRSAPLTKKLTEILAPLTRQNAFDLTQSHVKILIGRMIDLHTQPHTLSHGEKVQLSNSLTLFLTLKEGSHAA